MKRVKGFKAFSPDMICRDMQYEIGQEYKMDDTPIPCQKGYHFCKSIADCYSFYPMDDETVICEIEALGEVATDDDVKFCTNHIKIVKKVTKPREKSNKSPSCSGFCNSGNRNSGNWNSGDWNSGNRNSGLFCTDKNPKIKIFDQETDWTMDDWYDSAAYRVMRNCPYTYSDYIYVENMTDEEKENHPEHKTIGGYIKTFVVTNKDKQEWWDNLPSEDKQSVYELPNFDPAKFKECTGIDCGLEEK